MRRMTKEELKKILDDHRLWLDSDGEEGKCADLSYTDLFHVNLAYANLAYANLAYAYLSHADLSHADLSYADLSNADLYNVNLSNTKLTEVINKNIRGEEIIAVQVTTLRRNNLISYWPKLGIWTTGCFQGTLVELKKNF